jgi:hypothetical protein
VYRGYPVTNPDGDRHGQRDRDGDPYEYDNSDPDRGSRVDSNRERHNPDRNSNPDTHTDAYRYAHTDPDCDRDTARAHCWLATR